jgi:hypothetical protein
MFVDEAESILALTLLVMWVAQEIVPFSVACLDNKDKLE